MYVKLSTSSSVVELMFKLAWLLVLALNTLVLFVLKIRPVSTALYSPWVSLSCICFWLWDNRAMSSAKSRSSSCSSSVHCIPFLLLLVACLTAKRISRGDNKQPCLTPVVISKGSVSLPSCIILLCISE